jgi:hypothetical protein
MSTYLDALLSGQSKARSLATNEDAVDVDVAESAPPNPGDVLTAVDSTHATWQPPTGGGGGTAGELGSTGAPINVDGAAPPVPGQVLTAVDPEHAEWRVPGLHYDPSIKFWTASAGSATIASGTWGFVEQGEGATDPIVVYIVSSLEAPPVDARFGLYVGRDVTVPVSVSVLGASQIQGLDGELGPSTALLPGADYEWVFYHEDGAALWGLVSDTAGVAKRVPIGGGGSVPIIQDEEPEPNSVLTLLGDAATWRPQGAGWLTLASGPDPANGEWAIALAGNASFIPNAPTVGMHVAVYVPKTAADVAIFCAANAFQIDRTLYAAGTTAYVRAGGWYEWVSATVDSVIVWLPVGASARPPLEFASPPTDVRTNNWLLASLAAVSGVITMPLNKSNGDSLAIYTDVACSVKIVDSGTHLEAPDLSVTVGVGVNVPLTAGTYYEWIYIDADSTWHPRQNMLAGGTAFTAGAGLTLAGGTLAVGANADASIVVNADDIRVGVLATDAQHGVRGGGTTHALATGSASGFMSAAQFSKLAAFPDPTLNNFRLSNGGNSLSDDAVSTPLNLVAHNGNRICLYTGTEWAICIPSSAPTINVSGQTSGIPCDVWAVYSSPTALTLELTPWTSATVRATAIVQIDGVWTKSGAQTRRYLGTILPNAATTYLHQTDGQGFNGAICGVWNQDNRMLVSFLWRPSFATWTATGTGWQNLNAVSSGNFQLLQGRSIDMMSAVHWANVDPVGTSVSVGIGIDSSTTPTKGLRDVSNGAAGTVQSIKAEISVRVVAIGAHLIQPIVNTTAATPIFSGVNGAQQAGLLARHWC